MSKVERDLIEYIGIESCLVKEKKDFKQTNIEQVFCIPNQKPDIEQINKVWAKGSIKEYEVVKTPIGTSIEGQIMTGYKLLVCGDIKLKVEYVALEELNQFIQHTQPFLFVRMQYCPQM